MTVGAEGDCGGRNRIETVAILQISFDDTQAQKSATCSNSKRTHSDRPLDSACDMNRLVREISQAFDDIEFFRSQMKGYEISISQLTPGRFGFKKRAIYLPGLVLSWPRHTQSFVAEETFVDAGINITILLNSDGDVGWYGRQFSTSRVLLQRTGEVAAFSARRNTEALRIRLSPEFAELLALDTIDARLSPITYDDRRELIRCANLIAANVGNVNSLAQVLDLRQGLLARLEKAFRDRNAEYEKSVSEPRKGWHYQLFARATALQSKQPSDKTLDVRQLADAMGISSRTLHRAFETWTGVSLARFFEIERLNDLHRHLHAITWPPPKMSDIAGRYGFSNAGRMARRYSELFGEFPSETLRRVRAGVPRVSPG